MSARSVRRGARSAGEAKPVVLILDGESPFALGVVRALAADGTCKIALATSGRPSPAWFSRHVYQRHRWKTRPHEEAYTDEVLALARRAHAHVILGVDLAAIGWATQMSPLGREEFTFADVPPAWTFAAAADKWEFARLAGATGIPHPRTWLVGDGSPPAGAGPWLVKPRHGSYGVGIAVVPGRTELDRLYERTRQADARPWIVQDVVPGADIDCSVLCKDGEVLAFTVQRGFGAPPAAFRSPGAIEFVDDEAVRATTATLMRRLSWSGVAHVDLRYDARTHLPTVLEVNPRYWGSLLGSVRAGVNFPALACRLARTAARPGATQRTGRQYVAGATAVRMWVKTSWQRGHRLPLADTVFSHVRRDPLPELSALALRQPWRRASRGRR